jgi:hypothetical protein
VRLLGLAADVPSLPSSQCLLLLVVLPTVTLSKRGWYLQHREVIITAVRLAAAAAAPLWLLRSSQPSAGACTVMPHSSGHAAASS